MRLRPCVLVFLALALLLGAGAARAQNLLVLPFENTSRNPRLDWIGEGFAELSVERLTDGGRTAFPREERIAAVERIGLPPSTHFTRATMLKLAKELDADYVVFGSFTSDGKTLSATARVLRAEPASLSQPLVESGPLADLMEVHARLAWRVLGLVDPALALSHQAYLQSLERPRLDAFEHFVRGVTDANEDQRRRSLREAARLAPDWPPPVLALGLDSYARRDCTAALTWLDRIPPDQRHGLEALFFSGLCHLQRNDAARAETAFSGVVERARSAEALNNLGVARARQDNWREAAAVWQQAQTAEPGEPDYSFNLGLAALRNNEPAAAVRYFREALRRKPDDTEARVSLVAALERGGRAAEAAAEREAVTGTAAGASPSPRLKTSFTAPVASRARRPASEAQRATHLELHLSRGREFLAEGKAQEAQREFSEAVLIAPESVDAHVGLAQALERLGRREEAIRELRAALKLDPGHAPARRLLEALESAAAPGGRP